MTDKTKKKKSRPVDVSYFGDKAMSKYNKYKYSKYTYNY